MDKFLIISILLFVIGIIFFGLAGNCYQAILNLQELYGYYGLQEKEYLSSVSVAQTFASLKFGIIKFSILGVVAWILGIVFFLKRKNKVLLNK